MLFQSKCINIKLPKKSIKKFTGKFWPQRLYRSRYNSTEKTYLLINFVIRAFDLERQRQAQIRDELEAAAKVELVRRIRVIFVI